MFFGKVYITLKLEVPNRPTGINVCEIILLSYKKETILEHTFGTTKTDQVN